MLKKRLGKKGFTLVEVIVVLVILAILAAILIPSMVKWIDKAQDKSALVAGRTLMLAAQTVVSENYPNIDSTSVNNYYDEMNALADIEGGTITAATVEDGTVTGITYSYGGETGLTFPPPAEGGEGGEGGGSNP